ncbi:DUF4136 domain-containing protein [Hymenobacter baengnokdamensis]|uniref:DUF4136 domain-containing protein n=1 Tax=Hymenobacter baengnokdamensis TaxID=2615203 RepID=UPI001248D18A|nr:DUF4136 domain-containing protein [Hymenobacter baengnokdamensis]
MRTLPKFLKMPLLALALGLGACSAEQLTQTDQKTGVNLASYQTYNFMDETARNDSAFQHSGSGIFDLKRAVAHELESRGFRRAAQPDLWVNIGIVTQQKDQTRQTDFRTDGAPQYIGQRNYHWQAQEVVTGQYQEGTATIELVDAARKEQVWQGTTTRVLSRNTSKSARQIDEGVAELFRKFPVPTR